ncbi:hypothetical protein [Streptomyces antibioticus]|uniref:hypothetical protein n=1 Tax=Streptomyces antibioticus TaxID=1890 RepID=UPI003D70BC0A
MIARETVGQVLAEPDDSGQTPVAAAEVRLAPVAGAVRGSVVPVWREGLEAAVLAPDYRRIVEVLTGRNDAGDGALDCRQLAAALGLEPVRRQGRGGAVEGQASGGAGLAARVSARDVQHRPRARRRVMTMLIDQWIIASAVSVRVS